MDLLPAYRALIVSPEHLALCGQATTVAQLLQMLRDLWPLESVADGPLIAELGRCNQQSEGLDPRQLAGHWFPAAYHAASRTLSWCLPQGHATEPFQDQYIDRCRQHSVFNQLVQPRTPIASLLSDAPLPDAPVPAGFILHLSRCGSTLVSGCLAELDNTAVLSESPLLTDVLLDVSLTDEHKRVLLPKLVALQAAPFPGRDRLIVKWNAWDLLAWPLLRSMFPGVPTVLLFRDPEEILASHARSAGRHMAGDPALGRLNPAFLDVPADATLLDLRIEVLRGLLQAMAPLAEAAETMALDYTQLDIRRLRDVCRHFGLGPGADELARMARRMGFHSKETTRPFEADGARKKSWFDAEERQQIRRELGPDYRSLLARARRSPGADAEATGRPDPPAATQ